MRGLDTKIIIAGILMLTEWPQLSEVVRVCAAAANAYMALLAAPPCLPYHSHSLTHIQTISEDEHVESFAIPERRRVAVILHRRERARPLPFFFGAWRSRTRRGFSWPP